MDERRSMPLLQVQDLSKQFPLPRSKQFVHAVDRISFVLDAGETLGIVGESGCGKSTAARMIVRLTEPSMGSIRFQGADITALSRREMRPYRRSIQFIFQDPYSSLNPRMRAGRIVAEPLENFRRARGAELQDEVAQLFERVGLRTDMMNRFPHEFSGGQRQRLGIARALAVNPRIIVADEAVSALDVSVQAQILNLMIDLQKDLGLSYLFISHDLSVVQHISQRVAVMYLGRIIEIGPTDSLYSAPLHPYTQALLDAAPVPDPSRRRKMAPLSGEVPSPIDPPSGCHFRTRCPFAVELCRSEVPTMREVMPDHHVACHLR